MHTGTHKLAKLGVFSTKFHVSDFLCAKCRHIEQIDKSMIRSPSQVACLRVFIGPKNSLKMGATSMVFYMLNSKKTGSD